MDTAKHYMSSLSYKRRSSILHTALQDSSAFVQLHIVSKSRNGKDKLPLFPTPLRFTADTKVKVVVRKIGEKLNTQGNRSESTWALFMPAKDNTSDDVRLEDEAALWNYDVSALQVLEWREIPSEMPFHELCYLKLVLDDTQYKTFRFNKNCLVSDAISIMCARCGTVLDGKDDLKNYGLYLYQNKDGIFLQPERTLQSYGVANMDMVQLRKKPMFEFSVLTSNSANAEAELLCFEPNVKVSDVIKVAKDYMASHNPQDTLPAKYGLVHVAQNKRGLSWLQENKELDKCSLHLYDILELKNDTGDKLVTTIDHASPSIKMVIISTPELPEESSSPTWLDRETNSSNSSISQYPTTRHNTINVEQLISQLSYEDGEFKRESIRDITYTMKDSSKALEGVLVITNYRIVFTCDGSLTALQKEFFDIPLANVSRFEKIGGKNGGGVYGIAISCKDLRTRGKAMQMLERAAFCDIKSTFAFAYGAFRARQPSAGLDGWQLYDAEREFQRMFQNEKSPRWRITELNKNYAAIPTYPEKLIVPKAISDEALKAVVNYRSKGRIPVLCYYHQTANSCLLRCAQPLSGIKRNRCVEDEHYLNVVREMNLIRSKMLIIIDCRPKANAVANIATGGGYENIVNYPNAAIEFYSIQNIHVMRDSLMKLQTLTMLPDSSARWLQELDSTRWFEHIRLILEATVRCIDVMENGVSVVIHCSDGWDRTSQVTGLVQLCLDPYFRTLQGFAILVEKEWLSFGHQFQERIGHCDKNYADEQRSPTFLQFVECVYQLMVQFPTSFEWNEQFLITIVDHLYSCKYGTFFFNSERERVAEHLKSSTVSLWTDILANPEEYTNPFFMPSMGVLFPSAHTEDITFWKGYYLRWQRKVRSKLTQELRARVINNTLQQALQRIKALEAENERLRGVVNSPTQSEFENKL